MESIVPIAIWAGIILLALGLLGMVLFGVRSLINGKLQPMQIAIVLVPAVLLVILGLVLGDWAMAGIWTLIIMFVLATLALLFSGIRGLIS